MSLWQGHQDSIEALVADGLHLLSASCDGIVRVWNVSTIAIEGIYILYIEIYYISIFSLRRQLSGLFLDDPWSRGYFLLLPLPRLLPSKRV